MTEYLAKPTGVTLEDHVQHVLREAEDILASRPFIVNKYKRHTGNDLRTFLLESARYHDEGKKHGKWQRACQLDFEEWKSSGKTTGRHLRESGIRHEMASLEMMRRMGIQSSSATKAAIAAHHGKLGQRYERRWSDEEAFRGFWLEFVNLSASIRLTELEGFNKAIRSRYEYSGPRSLLQLADHRASMKEENKFVPELKDFRYNFPVQWAFRSVQRLIQEHWDESFMLLRAPTGSGKTDAALLWAGHQIEAGRADRLVIAMPTRFTSNALAVNLASSLGDVGLYHSTTGLQQKENIDVLNDYARLLLTPVTVTTIDHLCICLTGTREDHHSIFFNLAHSCVVIDEVDFYDDFTQANILYLLKVLKILNVPVLLMSATLPEAARKYYSESGYSISQIHNDKSDYDRTRCNIVRCGPAEKPEDIGKLLEQALHRPTIIYANTIARAMMYQKWCLDRGVSPILYHSRFKESDKVKIEERLSTALGRDSWEKKRASGVAILTQIGEVSVNISADFMISDVCPVDRLCQRAGRLSRFNKSIGEMCIVDPFINGKLYPAPYGIYNLREKVWEATKSMNDSIDLLRDGGYSARRFVELVNTVYPDLAIEDSSVALNQRNLEKHIITDWLIIPEAETDEDDTDTIAWRSRRIPAHEKVHVEHPPDCFGAWTDFRIWSNQNSVECPKYLIRKGVENGALYKVSITIGDDEDAEYIWVTKFGQYSAETGLTLDETDTII